jgi:integrase
MTTAEALYRFITGDRIPRRKAVAAAVPNRRGRGYDRLGVRYLGPSARRALRVKEPKKLIDPMTADQVKALFAAFHRYRDLAIVYLMLFCGLRSCEVLAIQLDDIDTENGVLRVRGKGDKQRVVPLARTVSRAIAAFLRLERPRHCLAQHLFVVLKGARRGCPMTRAGLRSLFRGRRRNPVLNNANPHNLRHTFGTQMARAGMRLPALKKLMGHADANTTFRYINLSLGDIAEAFHDACEKIGERYET